MTKPQTIPPSPPRSIVNASPERNGNQLEGETAILELQDVFKIYREQDIETVALRGASLKIEKGEFVAIVGRSGSGKSTLMGIAAGLTSPNAGKVLVEGRDIGRIGEEERAALRQRFLGIVFQNNNLIPFLTARENVELAILTERHNPGNRHQRAISLLERVGLADRLNHRPGQLSGGEQQRVAIALALANQPTLLLADELTGELDSATAASIMQLLLELNEEQGMAVVLVTHNLELAVQAGRSLRMADGLLSAFDPAAEQSQIEAERQLSGTLFGLPTGPVVLQASDLVKTFNGGIQALRSISLDVRAGESLAIMGPSGCGKSTLLNLLGGLDRPTQGVVKLNGQVLSELDNDSLAHIRCREIGFIFQAHNLIATLTAAENVALPLLLDKVGARERNDRANELLNQLGIGALADKLPDQMSGGQRQRVAIARSLAHRPQLLLADEPTGSLDSDTASQVATLLTELARSQNLALVMVTHDAQVAAQCGRVIHLLDGQLQEQPAIKADLAGGPAGPKATGQPFLSQPGVNPELNSLDDQKENRPR